MRRKRYRTDMENNNSLIIRDATKEDSSAILAIYAPYVKNTAISFEYEVPSEETFQKRVASILEHFPYIVAEIGGEIVGYAYAGILHEREAYQFSAELSIYVAENMRRKKIGEKLYAALESRLKQRGFHALYACIASTDRADDPYLTDASPRFHERLGYKHIGTFTECAYKFGRWYSMVYYEKHI